MRTKIIPHAELVSASQTNNKSRSILSDTERLLSLVHDSYVQSMTRFLCGRGNNEFAEFRELERFPDGTDCTSA